MNQVGSVTDEAQIGTKILLKDECEMWLKFRTLHEILVWCVWCRWGRGTGKQTACKGPPKASAAASAA